MTRNSTSNLEPFDPEIERTFHSLQKLVKEKIATVKEELMERQDGAIHQLVQELELGMVLVLVWELEQVLFRMVQEH